MKLSSGLVTILTGAAIALWTQPTLGQPDQLTDELKALKKDMEALKEGQTAIQREIQEIKALLRLRATGPGPTSETIVSVEGAPFKGHKNATLTLVDFTDYQ